jgi:hypothetical protein
MIEVESSNIHSIGHDQEHSTMRVKFKNNTEYEYGSVNAEQFEAFRSAPSVGSHFHANIKGKFEHRRI